MNAHVAVRLASAFDSRDCATYSCPNEAATGSRFCSYCQRNQPPVVHSHREEAPVSNVTCKVEGCGNVAPAMGRYAGYCATHRARRIREGDTVTPAKQEKKRALAAVPDPVPSTIGYGPERDPVPSIVDEAAATVLDRMSSYGDPHANHTSTAEVWTAYLRRRGLLAEGAAVDAQDVCWLNVMQKIIREANVRKRDNRVDVIGFAINADLVERTHG